jgi:hypothetical protein
MLVVELGNVLLALRVEGLGDRERREEGHESEVDVVVREEAACSNQCPI